MQEHCLQHAPVQHVLRAPDRHALSGTRCHRILEIPGMRCVTAQAASREQRSTAMEPTDARVSQHTAFSFESSFEIPARFL
jgi:hypothetical protein